jgi:hypothetical protein
MTKLQDEISDVLLKEFGKDIEPPIEVLSKAAAEVAKRYIEKAWLDSKPKFTPKPTGSGYNIHELNYNHWLKDNGVI